MRRWTIAAIALGVLASAALAASVEAGGWATVQLDAPIGEVRAGQTVDVGFVVKQHGETPIHTAYGQPVRAVFIARSDDSGESFEQIATPEKRVGHFRVQVVFPRAGRWQTEIVPEPFAGTRLAPVTVLTAGGERHPASAADEASIGRAPALTAAAREDVGSRRNELLAAGMVAAALALTGAIFLAGTRGRARAK